MMAPDPLDNNRNWVRAAMGLKYLKEGLESFVEDKIVNLQTTFLQDIRSSHGLSPTATCNQCTLKQILAGKCPNKLCDKIAVKIVDQHRYTPIAPNGFAKNYNAPCWKNTDVTKWGSAPWEIAKCFMSYGYSSKLSAKETDCTGILSVLINCLSFQNTLTTRINPPNDIISKMRETRNKIMHSSNLEVTDVELQQYIDDMIDILDDSKTIQSHPDAVTARTKLNRIKTNIFVISSRDELELRKKAVEAIEQKQNELLEQCKKQQAELQSKLDQTLTSLTQAKSATQQQQTHLQSKLNQTLASLTQAEGASQQQQTHLQSRLDQTMTSLTQAEGASQQQQTHLQSKLDQTLASLTQTESASQQQQTHLQLSLDQTLTSLTQAESASQQQQTHLQSRLNQTLTSLTQAESASQQQQTHLQSRLDQTLTSLTQAESASQQQQTHLQSKLDQTLTSLTQAESASKQQQTHLQSKLDQEMKTLSHNQAICQQNQNELQSKCDQTMASLAQTERQCQQKQDDIQSSQGQLHMKINSLQTQMTQMFKVLKKCQLDLQGGTDKHREHVKILEKRQLLQTRLREKYKRYQSTIPLSPIMKNMNVDIDKVYQKLVIRPDMIHDPNTKKQDLKYKYKYLEYFNRFAINRTENTIKDYRDIFYKDSVPCKNIFVVGNGGVGKTTWCLQLLNTWLNCKTNNIDKDSIFLQRFEYVYYIQLRHTKQASQLNEMIQSYLFSDENDIMNTVKDVLFNEPDQCLVLLDGLDEWKLPSEQSMHDNGLPFHPMDSKYTTLITSRPWKLEILRLKPPAIDKAVEIKGLDQDGILQLAGHIIDKLNCVQNRHKKVDVFMECFTKRKMAMIEVPLMLSIFVCLWYDNDFIGETFAGLYGKLTVNYFKHAEGDKRQIKQNRKVSKLADIKDIVKRKKKWSNITISLPDCLSKGWCKSYSPLLYSLGKLAFYGLLSNNMETFLVFTQDSIEEYINEEELEVALYIGILSQSQTIGDSTVERFTISFMHKTIQEFLAAVYMVSVTEHDETINMKRKFTNYCKELENVFEIENILIFICGMDPKLAGELTRDISIMHKKIKKNLESYRIPYDERLNQTLMRCVREEHLYLNESNHVYIVNHFIKPDTSPSVRENQNNINAETFSYIHINHNRIPMCLYTELCSDKEEKVKAMFVEYDTNKKYEYEDAICRCISEIQKLEKLIINGGSLLLYNDNGCLRILECFSHLHFQTLEIRNITGNLGYIDLSKNTELTDLIMSSIQIEELSLPHNGCLEIVKLKFIKHQHERLTLDIHNMAHLKHLDLEDITGNVGHINMTNNSKLTHLSMESLQIEELSLPQDGSLWQVELKSIKHPQGDQGRLTLNMNSQPHLEELSLEDITGNIGHINLSNNSKLTELTMTSLQIEELSFPQNGRLQRVCVQAIKHPQGDQGSLTLNMNNQPYLRNLTLKDIPGNRGYINLSNNLQLTDLSMESLQIEGIILPHNGCIEKLGLKYLKHPDGNQGSLIPNMNNQPCLRNLTLKDIPGNRGHINLSNNLQLTDLSMESLQIEGIILPHNGCIQQLGLKYLKHPDGDQGRLTLNMNNQPHLIHLTLIHITGNVGHVDLSNNAKLTYLTMESLQIEGISLPQDGCLETVELKSLKHPQGDQVRLTFNMNSQPHLEELSLEDITGNFGHIDLSNNSKLTILTMESLQIEELSLPHNGCLAIVKLKFIKHQHERLTLDIHNMAHLIYLDLEDITGNVGHINLSNNSQLTNLSMQSLQIEELLLPQGGCLETVEIKSLKHPQGDKVRLTFNMNSQPHLEELSLEDITGNFGHIDLSNNSKLTELTMESLQKEELSLPQDGCIWHVELKSIKHPDGDQGRLTLNMNNQPHLIHLTLIHITGNVGHVDLSNNAQLTYLTMESLQIEGISLPQNGCLETVELNSLKHPDGNQGRLTINMNNQPQLEDMTLEDITGNVGHIDLSNNSKLTDLTMKSLQIEELSLPQCGCLQRVCVQSIKHQQGDQRSITLNMNNQPYLTYLTLEDITGNIGHINLSNNSKLESLTMTSLQIEELSLTKDGWLRRVELKSIKHPQGDQGRLTLNMNNQQHLYYFTLEDISCNIGHIDLSKHTELTAVSVISVPLVSITVPPGVVIEK